MGNNYPPGCCKKLISKHKGHSDFQKAELSFPFESNQNQNKTNQKTCFVVVVVFKRSPYRSTQRDISFRQYREASGFRGQESDWSGPCGAASRRCFCPNWIHHRATKCRAATRLQSKNDWSADPDDPRPETGITLSCDKVNPEPNVQQMFRK